jgi:8-oxo-dGTP diphosphatase
MTRFAFSSAVYARNAGAVLLVHHKRLDCWLPVGGELEPGESPYYAAIRELREETGLGPGQVPKPPHPSASAVWPDGPNAGQPFRFIGYEEHDAGSKGTHGTFSFLFDVEHRDVRLCDEHHAFEWVDGWASELAGRYPMPPNVVRYLTKIRHEYGRRP